tara:strand:+ start:320 stop:898 length:579 start_codon:yes stop_codon:yes gene_type:complete
MEEFWINNYKILFKNTNNFLPEKNMSRNGILNLLTRYSIILLLFFIFIRLGKIWISLPITIIILCIVFHYLDIERSKKEKRKKIKNSIKCRKSTLSNPFMNILSTESKVDLPACSVTDEKNIENIDKNYKFNLYQNINDLTDSKHLKRQFYTMPVTTIPSKQNDYADWLYRTEGNCKSDGINCLNYEDERYH